MKLAFSFFPGGRVHRLWHLMKLGGLAFAGTAVMLLASGCGAEPVAASIPKSSSATMARVSTGAVEAGDSTSSNKADVFPQSVFHSAPGVGFNPFFPNSKRALAKGDAAAPAQLPLISYLKLVGVRPGTARPMALINRTPLAPGEEANVAIVISNEFNKAEVQKVNVRCLEIRRDSVLISIAGEEGVKELRMAHGK